MGLTPHRIPSILPALFPSLIWRVKEKSRTIYLSFDDGPVPGPTEFVLDILLERKLEATFFCIGDNIAKHPDIFKSILKSGHAVGNHTYNHLKGWTTSNQKYIENIKRCDAIIDSFNATPQKLFRPPYGRIRRNQIKLLSEYKIAMWDVLSLDYQGESNSEKLLRGSIASTRPGSIIVFHDSYKAQKNMEFILPRYIDHFIEQGYLFKKLEF